MNVRIESSKIVKPLYDAGGGAPPAGERVPLSVFDRVTYDVYMAVIYAFRPPTPPNAALELGLAKTLAVYREGALFVEATVSAPLAAVMPFGPSPELLRLHPSTAAARGGRAGELVRVQLTRFACGSLVIGFTSHHRVADGQAAGNFLVAWGLASRRLPVCDRATRFPPRDPPLVQFPHRETEYYAPKKKKNHDDDDELATVVHDKIKVHKVHFTKEFVAGVKARASSSPSPSPSRRGYSTFQSVHAAELIRRAVARADDAYFRSFVDFASSGAVEAEGLAATADESQAVLCPDVEVDSWLGIDFYDLDFGGGGGGPVYFTPSYLPMEGTVFLVPSLAGDGSIDAYVALFETHLDEFKKICYTY
uniref:Uncharacterized protein n=1 Tax=Oryza meridionalis TaxID=40149 RepID=A0A0E0DL61_9ORYZ